jgi:hypothetical protein
MRVTLGSQLQSLYDRVRELEEGLAEIKLRQDLRDVEAKPRDKVSAKPVFHIRAPLEPSLISKGMLAHVHAGACACWRMQVELAQMIAEQVAAQRLAQQVVVQPTPPQMKQLASFRPTELPSKVSMEGLESFRLDESRFKGLEGVSDALRYVVGDRPQFGKGFYLLSLSKLCPLPCPAHAQHNSTYLLPSRPRGSQADARNAHDV